MAPEVSLALGAGGVRGFSHVGVLKVLEREGLKVCALAGTSIGGLIGAIYAAGYSPDEIETQLKRLDQSRLYRRHKEDGPGIYGTSNIRALLINQLGDIDFKDLKIPFAVTAVDIDSGQLLGINHGSVVDAVLATISVPGVFPPMSLNGRTLLDGGVLDPVPVELARELAPGKPVVAVSLAQKLQPWAHQPVPGSPSGDGTQSLIMRFLGRSRFFTSLLIFLRSVNIASHRISEYKLQLDQPDVIIRPQTENIGLLDQVDVAELCRIGSRAAELEIDRILEAEVSHLPGANRRAQMGYDEP